jgi:polar amino acid transport system permease protein
MSYTWHFYVIWDYRFALLRGALLTAELTVLCLIVGITVGLPLGLMRGSRRRWPRMIAGPFIELFRSTPTLVQLVWIYYAMPILIGVRIDTMVAVTLGLGLHSAAYLAEIFRAGIASVDRGQFLAAKAIGMTHKRAMRRIILPQAVRRMVPPFINELANLIKLTTLASILSVPELLHVADDLIAQTFRPFEIYTAVAVIFLVIVFPMIYASRRLEAFWHRRS